MNNPLDCIYVVPTPRARAYVADREVGNNVLVVLFGASLAGWQARRIVFYNSSQVEFDEGARKDYVSMARNRLTEPDGPVLFLEGLMVPS